VDDLEHSVSSVGIAELLPVSRYHAHSLVTACQIFSLQKYYIMNAVPSQVTDEYV